MTQYILIIAVAAGIAVGSGGTLLISKAVKPEVKLNCPACPACNCPPATEVKLQDFDLSKLNNKKGNFTYSPQLHNVTIKIEAKDSTLLKQALRNSK